MSGVVVEVEIRTRPAAQIATLLSWTKVSKAAEALGRIEKLRSEEEIGPNGNVLVMLSPRDGYVYCEQRIESSGNGGGIWNQSPLNSMILNRIRETKVKAIWTCGGFTVLTSLLLRWFPVQLTHHRSMFSNTYSELSTEENPIVFYEYDVRRQM
jgi:hypothetical protein